MTRAEPQARVNIKYNHTDSKVTYLVSFSCCHEYILNESSILLFEKSTYVSSCCHEYISVKVRCHEYILNESSILSFEIQVNLCKLMISVFLKCYIYKKVDRVGYYALYYLPFFVYLVRGF